MTYKVVFVEDEIVTREGVRDNVDWKGHRFEFSGEAGDGELALQLLQTTKPDLLITDIKMPFMDGLQLCKIVRERMPWLEIVILSGHDEFEYAQAAMQLGVTEYLLKPVTVQDVHNVLDKIACRIDKSRAEQENLRRLRDQVDENQAALRERFLLKLVTGAIPPSEAIEKSETLGLDLIARCYLVVILKAELADRSDQFDYDEYQNVLQTVSDLIGSNPDVFLLKKDWEDLVLLIKGTLPEILEEERDLLLERIKRETSHTRFRFTIGAGAPKNRIAHIYQSFVEALVAIQNAANENRAGASFGVDKAELSKMDKAAVGNYLRSGVKENFNEFFEAYIRPMGEAVNKSHQIKNYIFVDVVLTVIKFVNEVGGNLDQPVSVFNSIESILVDIKTIEQLREQVYKIMVSALAFRDARLSNQYALIIQQAKEFIDQHYMNPDLYLNEVAARVNLSPSHFSVVFSQETQSTFKEYLTDVRIQKAKELLRMTNLKFNDIAFKSGYNDPHYFSFVFRKNTGLTPTEFRLQSRSG